MNRGRQLAVLAGLTASLAALAAPQPLAVSLTVGPSIGTAPPFFVGDFDTGDFSQWRDFHDAHLDGSPPGFEVVASPRYGMGHAARVNVTDRPDSSIGGDLSMLWDGDTKNSYELPYLQDGQTTWFRMQFAIPDGSDPSFPGSLTPSPGSWAMIYVWHTNPYRVATAYSSYLGIHWGKNTPSDPATILFRPAGGPDRGKLTYLYQTNGLEQRQANRVPLRFNHWYDVAIRITFGSTAGTGSVRWWVDGVQQTSADCPTIAVATDNSKPGVGHEIGFYRGPTKPYVDSMYVDGVTAGPTRSSVGALTRTFGGPRYPL